MRKNLTISKRRMSLFSAFIIGLVFISGLSGCSFSLKKKPDPLLQSDYLNHDIEYKDPDDKECLRVLVRLLQAVDQKDRETIKGMFSKDALEHIDDIDEKIDLFIETFPTWECKYDPSFGGMGKHANRGTITKWIKPTFDFESEGRQYVLKFIYSTRADENPDQLGLSMIQIYENTMLGYSGDFEVQGEDSPHDIYLWDYTMDLKEQKPLVHYFDRSLLSDKGPDCVIFHLADDEGEKQMGMDLEVNEDEVTVLDEGRVPEYIHGRQSSYRRF